MTRYKGVKIYGTDTTAHRFPKSGVAKAKRNDTYLNTKSGCVYACDTAGAPDTATWKYHSVELVGKPETELTAPTLKRRGKGSRVVDMTWKVPAKLTETGTGKGGHRAEGVNVVWTLVDDDGKAFATLTAKRGTSLASYTVDLANFKGDKKTLKRSDFYPSKGKKKLKEVRCKISPYNSFGAGPSRTAKLEFKKPKAPSVSAISFNSSTGTASCTITTDAGNGLAERLWTEYKIVATKHTGKKKTTAYSKHDSSATSTSISLSYDAEGYQSLTQDQYIHVHVEARARGFAGDSAWVSRDYYIGFPRPSVICPGKGDDKKNVLMRGSGDSQRVVIPINTKYAKEHPVAHVKLEKLVNTDYAKASQIPGDAAWEDAGAVDDGQCTALVADVSGLISTPGKRTWVRVKSWYAAEEPLHAYSDPKRMDRSPMYTAAPTAEDDECELYSLTPCDDGESAWAHFLFADDGNTGTLVKWSTDKSAWQSTDPPDEFEATWKGNTESSVPADKRSKFPKQCKVKIKGLDGGKTYYVTGQRYLDDAEGNRTIGAACAQKSITISEAASDAGASGDEAAPVIEAVVLSAPGTAMPGQDVEFEWTVSTSGEAQAWTLYSTSGSTRQVLANGDGDEGATTWRLPATRARQYAVGNALTCAVEVTAKDGERVETMTSNAVSVLIAEPPTALALLSGGSTLAAQPMVFAVGSSDAGVSVSYVVRAASGSGGAPDVLLADQLAGDVVASGTVAPVFAEGASAFEARLAAIVGRLSEIAADRAEQAARLSSLQAEKEHLESLDSFDPDDPVWNEENGYSVILAMIAELEEQIAQLDHEQAQLEAEQTSLADVTYSATVTLPEGLDFRDGASYELEMTATDALGLSSEPFVLPFAVSWARHAPVPPLAEVDVDETDDGESGQRRRCSFSLVPPDGSEAGDVYDVYRVTHDGVRRVSPDGGFPLTHDVVDDYAPFGDAGDYLYRVACRTADGDVAWSDLYYYMEGGGMLRFDWGESDYVELPYNLGISDSFSKDFERRAHMDGSREGYWAPGRERDARLSTDVMRIADAGKATALRSLAQHAGPVWVRTPDGSAYEADVQVTDMDVSGGAIAVQLDAKEVDGRTYVLPVPQTEEGE